MKDFMGEDFLLQTETARRLYKKYAANLPIIDYHCHVSAREIYEDRRFESLDQVWLGGRNEDGTYSGDHYKWRLMRSHGIEEQYITGSASGEEKVQKFAEALELAIGNPMVHWTNLELKRYFGIEEALDSANALTIYKKCSRMLKEDPNLTVQGMIRKARVEFIGTTDDPADTLEWHKRIADDPDIDFQVCPTFRPDKALAVDKPGYRNYIRKLAETAGVISIDSAEVLLSSLKVRLNAFIQCGCRAADHGFTEVPFHICSSGEADRIFKKAMNEASVSTLEAEQFATFMFLSLAKEYHKKQMVLQIHYSCNRNTNARLYELIGPDAGADIIAQNSSAANIAAFLSELDRTNECPKTVLYSLNSADNQFLDTLIGSFQTDELPGKIQHGSAWWFNDTKSGMEEQLRSLANLSILGNFIGMLTDSRSYLSYVRHEYFRRILCNFIGSIVEAGEYPNREESLKKIIEGICCQNARRYFGV